MFDFVKIGAYSKMKIRILDGRVINKKPAAVGDILEVPGAAAVEFIYRGWAEEVVDAPAEKPAEPVKTVAKAHDADYAKETKAEKAANEAEDREDEEREAAKGKRGKK